MMFFKKSLILSLVVLGIFKYEMASEQPKKYFFLLPNGRISRSTLPPAQPLRAGSIVRALQAHTAITHHQAPSSIPAANHFIKSFSVTTY